MILYPIWYRKHGIRRPSDLLAPKFNKLSSLLLPKDSLIHYFPEDDVVLGLAGDDILIKNDDRLVTVEHITELSENKGHPKPLPVVPSKLIREYHRKNKRVRWLKNRDIAFNNPKTLIVENYAILNHTVRYTTNFFSNYYRWFNVRSTLWDNLNTIAKESERQQYIKCTLPETLPSADLRKLEKRLDRTTLDKFKSVDDYNLADFWIWLGENRSKSALSRVETKNLDNLNMVWVCQDRWFVINLGMLNDWRATEVPAEGTAEGINPISLQKRVMKLLMSLYETKTVSEDDAKAIREKGEKEAAALAETRDEGSVDELHKESELLLDEDLRLFEDEEAELDLEAELNALNDLHKKLEEQQNVEASSMEINNKVLTKDIDLTAPVLEKANELADNGMLSAAEYRRLNKLAEVHKTLKNPYGEGLLIDEAKIDPKDIALESVTKFPDNAAVLDKSMLQNSVVDFDERYIKDFLRKDVLNSVLSIQNVGVAVTGYDVDRVDGPLGSYEVHKVKLVPVNGSPSTVSFRIPVVDKNGSYIANGVKYRLRKQRGD
jgi:hypothetical protein